MFSSLAVSAAMIEGAGLHSGAALDCSTCDESVVCGGDLGEAVLRECVTDRATYVGAQHLEHSEGRVVAVTAVVQFNRIEDRQETSFGTRVAIE